MNTIDVMVAVKDNSAYKTMRHIETVRNYINVVIRELLIRQEMHDQSKLADPELVIFNTYTPKLRNCTYGSDEYNAYLKEMNVALDHHYAINRHHPEYFRDEDSVEVNGLQQMNLVDLIEMLCDWKAASLRHNTGDIYKSIKINKKRFKYSDELENILKNTAVFLGESECFHRADES